MRNINSGGRLEARSTLAGFGFLLAVFLILLAPDPARACSVPVFRYGLEHWAPDVFEALVFHRGALSPAQADLLQQMRPPADPSAPRANLSVRAIDLADAANAEWLPLWENLKGGSLPWLVVRPAPQTRLGWLLASEPLTANAVNELLDSPARREIVSRIARGDSAVWLLLESGNAAKDQAAAGTLELRLAYLASVLKLPKLDEADIANGLVSVGDAELKLAFSTLRVSRATGAERLFVPMLLGVEEDLRELDEPMVFPVFGRGRALYALVGGGVNSETIDAAAIFLTGRCSCQVKEQNPGVDLLLTANWDGIMKRTGTNTSASAPVAPSATNATNAEPVYVTITGSNAPAPAESVPPPPARFPPAATVLALVALALWYLWRSR